MQLRCQESQGKMMPPGCSPGGERDHRPKNHCIEGVMKREQPFPMGQQPMRNKAIQSIAGKIWQALWQSGAMVVLACVIGLLVNEGRSDGLALVADWSPEVRLTNRSRAGVSVRCFPLKRDSGKMPPDPELPVTPFQVPWPSWLKVVFPHEWA